MYALPAKGDHLLVFELNTKKGHVRPGGIQKRGNAAAQGQCTLVANLKFTGLEEKVV